MRQRRPNSITTELPNDAHGASYARVIRLVKTLRERCCRRYGQGSTRRYATVSRSTERTATCDQDHNPRCASLILKAEPELYVRSVLGLLCFVRLREDDPAEGDRGRVPEVDEPANSANAIVLKLGEHRLSDNPCDARSPLIDPNRDHHEMAMFWKHPNASVLETLMGKHHHDLAFGLGDDDAPVEVGTSAIVLLRPLTILATSFIHGDSWSPRSNDSSARRSSTVAGRRITDWCR